MRLRFMCLILASMLIGGCVQSVRPGKTDLKEKLIQNVARDLAEINLMVESARSEYQLEVLSFRAIESWTRYPDKEIRKVTPSKAKIYNVLQRSIVEISTQSGPTVVHVLKIQGEEGAFIGIERPGRVGKYHTGVFAEEQASGYFIRFYDSQLAQDAGAVKSIRQYLSVTSRMEKAAGTILKKMMELQNKYRASQIQIESFHVTFPQLSIDIQFKFKTL